MTEYCQDVMPISRHPASVYCRDDRHAMVMYLRGPIPPHDRFHLEYLRIDVETCEPAMEALPLTEIVPPDDSGHLDGLTPYLVQFRQEPWT